MNREITGLEMLVWTLALLGVLAAIVASAV